MHLEDKRMSEHANDDARADGGLDSHLIAAALVESAEDAILSKSLDGIIRSWNPAAARILGYRADEIVGRSVTRLIPPDRLEEERMLLDRIARGERVSHFETVRRTKNGELLDVSLTISPIRDAANRIVGASNIMRDIGERKRTESLRNRTAEFGRHALAGISMKQLMHEAADLIVGITGVQFVRIGLVDATANVLIFKAGLGWPIELVDEHVVEVSHSAQAAESLRTGRPVLVERIDETTPIKPSEDALEQGMVGSATIPIRCNDATIGLIHIGSTAPLRMTAEEVSFLDAIGTITGLAISRDLRESEITDLNSQLKQRYDEMESFSYSVAHDLRSPLRAVAGFAAVLLEDFEETPPGEAKRCLKIIEKGATQMDGLIDALLALACVGRQEICRSRVDLSAIAEALAGELHAVEPGRNVVVTIQPSVSVTGDSALLRLVLQNLLSNAWKFTRDRNPASIVFSAARTDGEWIFRIADNGVGFIPSGQLFVPFQRFHGNSFEGTGIGLATVARIVRRHGGRVWGESEPGVGSTFFFTLGEATAPSDQLVGAAPSRPWGRPKPPLQSTSLRPSA
jgi:PAS domain S-box-containing protein